MRNAECGLDVGQGIAAKYRLSISYSLCGGNSFPRLRVWRSLGGTTTPATPPLPRRGEGLGVRRGGAQETEQLSRLFAPGPCGYADRMRGRSVRQELRSGHEDGAQPCATTPHRFLELAQWGIKQPGGPSPTRTAHSRARLHPTG